jgi:putative ABC transport system permease protein
VAQATGLALGGQFLGSHGLAPGGHEHGDFPYTVTGVLQPCACVLDRLILTPTESVWQVHEKATALDEADAQALAEEREITLALVRYSTPLAAVTFPRYVNSATNWQAAAPAQEISRLLRLVGVGTDVLRGFGVVLLLSAALSVFIGLWNAVRERRADLAMLRMLGAPPQRLAWLLVCEALWLAALACVLGLALGHGLTAALGAWLQADRSLAISGWVLLPEQTLVVLAAGLVALGAALLPAWAAYRLDVSRLLQER